MLYHQGLSFLFSVSILVLLEVPLRHCMNLPATLTKDGVSILVLLEVPLRPLRDQAVTAPVRSFNPCFAGSSS